MYPPAVDWPAFALGIISMVPLVVWLADKRRRVRFTLEVVNKQAIEYKQRAENLQRENRFLRIALRGTATAPPPPPTEPRPPRPKVVDMARFRDRKKHEKW